MGSSVWLSHRVLNDDRTMTLDNMTLDDISNRLNVSVNISDDSILDILESVVNV